MTATMERTKLELLQEQETPSHSICAALVYPNGGGRLAKRLRTRARHRPPSPSRGPSPRAAPLSVSGRLVRLFIVKLPEERSPS
jgi:hypothetical protein